MARPQKHFVDSSGKQVFGLWRQPDGRWRVIATGERYTEPDEQKAVQKFRLLQADEDPNWIKYGFSIRKLAKGQKWEPLGKREEQAVYDWVAERILASPQLVAERTGIKQLAYLKELQPPEPVPSAAMLETLWGEKATCSSGQRQKVLRAFRHWKQHNDVETLTPQKAVAYMEFCQQKLGYSPKQQQHHYNGIRRVFTFAISKAIAVDALKRRLGYLELLKPTEPPNRSTDPQPISKVDFHKLLKQADDQDRAMTYLLLNGAFTLGELLHLKWRYVSLKKKTLVTRRMKTGKCIRACVLWNETVKALKILQKTAACEYIFSTYLGTGIQAPSSLQKRFNELAEAARIPHVTGSMLRDGAQTAAAQANVSWQLIRVLAGHSSGIADHYIARKPEMTKPVTDAIYESYFSRPLQRKAH